MDEDTKKDLKFWKIVFDLAEWWQKNGGMGKDESLWMLHQIAWKKHGKELQPIDWKIYKNLGRGKFKSFEHKPLEFDEVEMCGKPWELPDTKDVEYNPLIVPTARQIAEGIWPEPYVKGWTEDADEAIKKEEEEAGKKKLKKANE